MTDRPTAPPANQAAPPPSAAQQAPAPPPPDRRVHLFDAAETQRARVLSSFDSQRQALLKAVDEQRAAAMAPIQAVRTRMAQAPAGLRGLAPGDGRSVGAGMDQRAIVAAQIIADLKTLIAEEVRRQIENLLTVAHEKCNAAAAANSETPQTE